MKALVSASMSALLISGCAASGLAVSDSSASRPNAATAPEPRSVGALSSAFRIEALDAEPQAPASPSAHEHHHGATAEPQPSQHGKADAADAAAVYTCPMHPEVVSKEQGACPECGMTLVPKKKPAGAP